VVAGPPAAVGVHQSTSQDDLLIIDLAKSHFIQYPNSSDFVMKSKRAEEIGSELMQMEDSMQWRIFIQLSLG